MVGIEVKCDVLPKSQSEWIAYGTYGLLKRRAAVLSFTPVFLSSSACFFTKFKSVGSSALAHRSNMSSNRSTIFANESLEKQSGRIL